MNNGFSIAVFENFRRNTFFGLIIGAPSMIADAWRTSSFTRVQLLRAEDAPRRFELSLHQGGYFLLRATFEPSMPCDHHGARITSFDTIGRLMADLNAKN